MCYIIDETADDISHAVTFAYVQRGFTSMLEEVPAGTSEAAVLEAVIQQATARLAFARSPEAAARYLGGTRRVLKEGGLRM